MEMRGNISGYRAKHSAAKRIMHSGSELSMDSPGNSGRKRVRISSGRVSAVVLTVLLMAGGLPVYAGTAVQLSAADAPAVNSAEPALTVQQSRTDMADTSVSQGSSGTSQGAAVSQGSSGTSQSAAVSQTAPALQIETDLALLQADTGLPVLSTDVSTPSEGCVFVGLQGRFYADDQAALNRINEIRYEACTAGNVPDPRNPDRMLTKSDYVPIKWSADLERVARVRAYEAAVTVAHARLNGKSIWSISSNGVRSFGEVLAWNWTTTMVYGVNQFYGEKDDWVNQNSSAVTGHYTQMIDPDHTYVGLGCFCSDEAPYFNCTAGEFNYETGTLDQTMLSGTDEVIQTIEVLKDNISDYELTADTSELKDSGIATMSLEAEVAGYMMLPVLAGVSYQSEDPAIAQVFEDGTIVAHSTGTITVTATVDGTNAASLTVTIGAGDAVFPVDSGRPLFKDVNPKNFFYDAVYWAVGKDITKGTSETTFSPLSACTRAQAVTFLWRAAGSEKVTDMENPFTDVNVNAYYYDAVLWAVGKGITNGTSETTFSPDDSCTRGQIVTFLWRAQGEQEASAEIAFKDVAATAYYYEPVKWAVEKNVTNGTSATAFSPDNNCTRGQIVTFLYRAMAD